MKKISIAFLSTLIFTPAQYKGLYEDCEEQKTAFTERHAAELLSCSSVVDIPKPETDYSEPKDSKGRLEQCDKEQKALIEVLGNCHLKTS